RSSALNMRSGSFFRLLMRLPVSISFQRILSPFMDMLVPDDPLDVIFKNKKKELVARGLDVTVGTISTLATLLLPDTMMATKSAIATLFGTKTAYEALQWLHEYKQAKDLLSNEKAWLLWRIKR
ncbi:MAG: hypothetical protein ACOYYJ_16925, partial [Chloroflexota bacterium]